MWAGQAASVAGSPPGSQPNPDALMDASLDIVSQLRGELDPRILRRKGSDLMDCVHAGVAHEGRKQVLFEAVWATSCAWDRVRFAQLLSAMNEREFPNTYVGRL